MKSNKLSLKNFARPEFVGRAKNPSIQATSAVDSMAYLNTDFFYDSFSIAPAAAMPQMTPMFQVPTSGAKTKAQTNMKGQGVLVNQDVFAIKRMRVIISGNCYIADAMNIAQLCSVKLSVNGRDYLVGPVLAFPGAGGIQLTAAAQVGTAPAGTNVMTGIANGDSNYKNAFTFQDEIQVKNGQQVEVDVTAETAFSMTAAVAGGVGATIYVFLDGRRLRSVA
jgi:hypothetical protein